MLRQRARSLFLLRGFHGVSLRKLGDHMGVHAGSLYYYIDSKQSLLFEIIEEYEESLSCVLLNTAAGSPKSRLLDFIHVYVSHLTQNVESFQLASIEYRNLTESQQLEISNIRLTWLRELESILSNGLELGEFSCGNISISGAGVVSIMNCLGTKGLKPSIAIAMCQNFVINMIGAN